MKPLSHCTLVAAGLSLLLNLNTILALADDVPHGVRLHVAADGNDTGDGSERAPLATLTAARQKIRAMKKNGPLPKGGVVVEMRGGRYEWTELLMLTAEDAGTAEAPITYRAFPGEKVTISGGRIVGDWKPVTDPAILQRLEPAARGKVFQTDLKALGVTEYGDLALDAAWKLQHYLAKADNQGEDIIGNAMASRIYAKSGKKVSPRLELFCNDVPMEISRWPNSGFIKIEKVLGKTTLDGRGKPKYKEGIFTYAEDRPSRWTKEKDAFVKGYWARDWAVQCHKIASIDTEKRIISVEKPYHYYGYRPGHWFFGFNMLCELDMPGEWYIDRQNGILYFWPPEPLKDSRVEISMSDGLFTLSDTAYITIRGLQMETARGTAVSIKDSSECRVVGCTFRNLGNHAVTIFKGKNCSVVGCDMSGMGGGGIYMVGGERETLTPGGHYAENNHIHHFARWDRMYRPGVFLCGVGLRASHNLIHHAPHAAILYGGQEHRFEYNEIHNVCQESHDCGAIYAGRSWCLQGDVFQYNYMHHLCGKDGGPCNGIYLDDENSGATIRGNVFYQVLRPVFIGGGRDNLVENNLFVDCPQAIHLDARGIGWAAYAVQPRIDRAKETGILCGVRFKEPPFSTRYPKLATMLEDEPAKPKGNIVRRNVFWQGDGTNLRRTGWDNPPASRSYRNAWWHHIQAKAFDLVTMEDNLIDVNPKIVDEKKGNFQLQKDSPVWEIGFQRIPFEKIGLYEDDSRASWPVTHVVTPLPEYHKR